MIRHPLDGAERCRLHRQAVERVVRALRYRKCSVFRVRGHGGVELSIGGPGKLAVRWPLVRIELLGAVRYAFPHLSRHHVTHGGRRYDYRYVTTEWNLHEHGRRVAQPDVWFLVDDVDVYVVPAAVLAGRLTYSLIARKGTGPRSREAVVRQYRNAWHVITGGKRRAAA